MIKWKPAKTKSQPVKIIRFDGSPQMVADLLMDDRFCETKNNDWQNGTFSADGQYNEIYLSDIPAMGSDTVFKDDFIVMFENGEVWAVNAAAAGFLFDIVE